jgi:hypothetical protein
MKGTVTLETHMDVPTYEISSDVRDRGDQVLMQEVIEQDIRGILESCATVREICRQRFK